MRRQCELLGVSRSGYYYEPCAESAENLALMRHLDELHLKHPVYGRPRLTVLLQREGWAVNAKRVGRLMRVMDIEAIYPKPGTSRSQPGHEIYPYLLRNKAITGSGAVASALSWRGRRPSVSTWLSVARRRPPCFCTILRWAWMFWMA